MKFVVGLSDLDLRKLGNKYVELEAQQALFQCFEVVNSPNIS